MSSGSEEQLSGSYNEGSTQDSIADDKYGSNIMDDPVDPMEGASAKTSFEEKEASTTSEMSKYLSVYDQTFDKIQIEQYVVEEVQSCL